MEVLTRNAVVQSLLQLCSTSQIPIPCGKLLLGIALHCLLGARRFSVVMTTFSYMQRTRVCAFMEKYVKRSLQKTIMYAYIAK